MLVSTVQRLGPKWQSRLRLVAEVDNTVSIFLLALSAYVNKVDVTNEFERAK